MAKVSWVDKGIYAVILNEDEQKQLDKRSNQHVAPSTFLSYILSGVLLLTERVEDEKEDVKDNTS